MLGAFGSRSRLLSAGLVTAFVTALRRTSQLSNHADDDAPDLGPVDDDRLHRTVRGLKADAPVGLTVEALERRLLAGEDRDDDLPVARLRHPPHDDEVAVADGVVDHRI